jgi:hypothetical protein
VIQLSPKWLGCGSKRLTERKSPARFQSVCPPGDHESDPKWTAGTRELEAVTHQPKDRDDTR